MEGEADQVTFGLRQAICRFQRVAPRVGQVWRDEIELVVVTKELVRIDPPIHEFDRGWHHVECLVVDLFIRKGLCDCEEAFG